MSVVKFAWSGAIATTLAAVLATSAAAQMELKLIAPAAPGGGWDQTARSLQQSMTAEKLVKSAQVINIPGAGGTVGLAQFIGNKGDGNTLMVNGFVMVGAILLNKSPVNLSQVTPVARLTEETQVIVVPANSPIKDAKDLAAAVKKDVARVTFAGGSAGGADHIMAGMFVGASGGDPSKVNYVPFSGGGESLAAIMGGRVTAGISGYGEYEGQIKSGRLRAIGVSSPNRLPGVNVPTFKEQGIDLVLTNWRSVVAPPGITPDQRIALDQLMERTVKSKAWQEQLKQKGWDDAFLPSNAFATFLQEEIIRVGGVLKSLGLVKS
ncbi:MAG TPA: tripartite tricarboxylate transporter substrate binding protein [Xanthobacteraceae bacterium]|nr:tripartite tricarboxylate transporter substrate binding protein [Xanthobacteraceae bacterium]